MWETLKKLEIPKIETLISHDMSAKYMVQTSDVASRSIEKFSFIEYLDSLFYIQTALAALPIQVEVKVFELIGSEVIYRDDLFKYELKLNLAVPYQGVPKEYYPAPVAVYYIKD